MDPQIRSKGRPISDPFIEQQAIKFNNMLHPEIILFEGSTEWLKSIKNSHNIKQFTIYGDVRSAVTEQLRISWRA